MNKMIAFDVDGTLIEKWTDGRDTPRYEVIDTLRFYKEIGHEIVIWSGGGVDYARMWADKLGLGDCRIMEKKAWQKLDGTPTVDLCFDDEEVELARVNIKV